jgi:glutamate carboxypeptidase
MTCDPRLNDFLTRQFPAELELLRQMVGMNSFSANKAGVDALSRFTAGEFADLGFTAEYVPSFNPQLGDHLVLTRQGRGPRTLGMIAHLDTVFPPEEEARNNFAWRPAGDKIYGPGTMDIKGGTVMMHLVLSAIREFAPDLFDDTTWVLLWNSSEEVLSPDFGKLCCGRLGGAVAGLVFEPGSREDDALTVVTSRKGRAVFRCTVEGRGAHAGGDHERGANAVVQMGEIVQRIAALTDYAKALTFNVGTISGGTVINRVPHQAVAEIEMRAFSSEVYQAGKSAILALTGSGSVRAANDGHRCSVKVEVLYETPPWPRNDQTEQLLQHWQQTADGIGLIVAREDRGGLSDGNFLWHAVPTLDGLGPVGDNSHCSEQSADGTKEQEYVEVSTFVPKAALDTLAILKLLE